MGLAEQVLAGGNLERKSISFTTDVSGIGTASLGSAYVLTNIQTNAPCRLRLYDDATSRDLGTEVNRVFGNTSIPDTVALIADFSMSSAGAYIVDPVMYSVSPDSSNNARTYYRITPPSATQVTIDVYNLEDASLDGIIAGNRKTLLPITTNGSISSGTQRSGSLVDGSIPRTYLLVSASLGTSAHRARVRLYSASGSLYDSTEKSRPFSVEPSASACLIADMILSGSSVTKFTPKIVGTNIQNMTNLAVMRGTEALIEGKNELYYIIENVGPSSANITANVHVYSLEN